jgi:hypothetical protein
MAYTLPHPEAKPPKLNSSKVPPAFRHLIPLAEKYGVSDDCYRIDLIHSLNSEELRECVSFLRFYTDVLDQWLAGPEADGPEYSDEYIVFSSLGMAADLAEILLRRIDSNGPRTKGA